MDECLNCHWLLTLRACVGSAAELRPCKPSPAHEIHTTFAWQFEHDHEGLCSQHELTRLCATQRMLVLDRQIPSTSEIMPDVKSTSWQKLYFCVAVAMMPGWLGSIAIDKAQAAKSLMRSTRRCHSCADGACALQTVKLQPNSFVFLSIPDASRAQWHPFTLSGVRNSNSPDRPAQATIYLKPYGRWVQVRLLC